MTIDFMINNLPVHAVYDDNDIENIFLPILYEIDKRQKEKNSRFIVMLAAPPACGKSTLAQVLKLLAGQIPGMASICVIGMDGFHHYNSYLDSHTTIRNGEEISLRRVKGSPETFNLNKLTNSVLDISNGKICFWPEYDRVKKDPVESAITVNTDIVLLEGNYLLLNKNGWKDLKQYSDFTIRISSEPDFLRERLISRKLLGCNSLDEATAFVDYSDMYNISTCLNSTVSADINIYLSRDGRYHLINSSSEQSVF